MRKTACILAVFAVLAALLLAQHTPATHQAQGYPAEPLPVRSGPMLKALELLREDSTEEARRELARLQSQNPEDPEIEYQIARSYLIDFYRETDPVRRRIFLNLAMERLAGTLKRKPDHIPALKAKSVIHARAELLYYDPNLAYELAARVAKLQPYASDYLMTLSDWMSGEVRFTKESGHRVPHDPLIGLDRALELINWALDTVMPHSNEETAALFQMGKALAHRGNFPEAVRYFRRTLSRDITVEQRMEALREAGSAHYRMGAYEDAAGAFFQALRVKSNPVDQWLLKVAMDQIKGAKPLLPRQFVFERPAPAVDPANPPLLKFEDIAPQLGVNRFSGNGTCAWGDIDNDGDQDLLVAGSGTFVVVYRNDGGKFTEVSEQIGLGKVPAGYSLNLVDYDNDGWLDLYLSYNGWSGPMKNRLYHNNKGHFEDVSAKSGADDPGSGFVSLWGDLDNDGWLDFVVANGVLKDGSVPQIYRNNRDGTFTNVTKAAGLDEPPNYGTIGIALGDYDKDGRLDILINGLEPAPNRLYHNDGNWHFTEVAKKAGVLQPVHNGFVCFFLDYNNDGWPDVLTTSLASWEAVIEGLRKGYAPSRAQMHPDASRLFRNNKDGTFTDVTYDAKLFYPVGVMGAGVADVDNDGYIDLYLGVGDPQMSRLEPNRFFHNNGDGAFSDLTDYVGFQRPGAKGHGVAFVDIDNDGDLDIYAQLGGHFPGDFAYSAFYRNLRGSENNWLMVDLKSVKSNRNAIGTQLTAIAGGLLVYREVKGSEGFGSTSPYRQHFGLGKHLKIDSLEIRWPSGVTQKIENLDARQVIEVTEGGAWRKVR